MSVITCPRCQSHSVYRNHDSIGCLACGHMQQEAPREAWDTVAGGNRRLAPPGPAWTDAERAAWSADAAR
jgi:hypothetical protein